MDISIIICTWNNSKRLKITLGSLVECMIPNGLEWEVILVNNNCTDDTDKVVSKFTDKLHIVYVKELIQGLSRARNTGLKQAQGKLIVFTDDDVTPCKEWVSIYWNAYQSNPTGYFWGGPIESEFEEEKPNIDLLSCAPVSVKGFDGGKEKHILTKNQFFVSANWACPRSIVIEVGGFDESLGLNTLSEKKASGEETDLMFRLKQKEWKAMYLPEAGLMHFVPRNKTKLAHICTRVETNAYSGYQLYEFNKNLPVVFGIPLGVYKMMFVALLGIFCSILLGRNSSKDRVRFCMARGLMRGFYESRIETIKNERV